MTQDEIIEMARQAGLDIGIWEKLYDDDLFGYSVQGIHENLEEFADQILEEVAQEIAKLPFGDTASSFAVFVRQMKVNRSDNDQRGSRLSAAPTSAE